MFPNYKKLCTANIFIVMNCEAFCPAKLSRISTISHTPHIHKYLQCSELENEVPLALHNAT